MLIIIIITKFSKPAKDRSTNETSPNLLFKFKNLRTKNPNKVIIGSLNINLLWN